MKAIWSGVLSLGLLNIPIKLYSAQQARSVSFTLICSRCGSKIEYKRWCPKCKREVPWDEVLKGYQIGKGKYVTFKKEELERLVVAAAKQIQIVEFVDPVEIDPIFFDKSYYVVPEAGGEQAFVLFREALAVANRWAVGKAVLRGKEHIVVLRAYQGLLLLTTLYYEDEIKPTTELEIPRLKVDEKQLKLARQLIKQFEKPFKISEFKNKYKKFIEQLVKAKLEGKKIKAPQIEEVPDLMKALEESLEVAKVRKKKSK